MTNSELHTYSPELISRLAKEIHPKALVVVAGGSSTGKTSLVCKKLESELQSLGKTPLVIHQDGYQKGKEFVEKNHSPYKWDDPENFSFAESQADLQTLFQTGSVQTPLFSIPDMKRVGEQLHTLPESEIVLFEGLYAILGAPESLVQFSIYVESTLYARVMRRIFRFVHEMNIPHPDTAIKQMITTVLRAHEEQVSQQRELADIIIRVEYSFAETLQNFTLPPIERSMLEPLTPSWSYSPNDTENVVLSVLENENTKKYFCVEHQNTCLFLAEISDEVANLLPTLDWESY